MTLGYGEDHQEWMTRTHPAIADPRRNQRQEVHHGCIGRNEQALGYSSKLSARAKEAEDHAAAARDKAKADIEADREDARAVGEQQAQALREKAEEGRERISDGWADVQKLGRPRRRNPRRHRVP